MADNYLGKQYADYEIRRAAWEKAKRLGTAKRSVKRAKLKTAKDKKEEK
ncbi:MAG: hypothetical protein ACRC9P_00400 [Bacteroides sp.]